MTIPGSRWLARAFGGVAGANVLLVTALFAFLPSTRHAIVREDGWLENVSVLCFLGAVLLGLRALRLRPWPRALLYAAIPLLAFLALLSEIGFGERWLPFTMPVVDGKKMDGIHDLLQLPAIHHYIAVVEWAILEKLPVAVTLSVALAGTLAGGFGLWLLRGWLASRPALVYLGISIVLVSAGLIADLDLPRHEWIKFAEEMLETNGSLALLFAALAISSEPESRS